MGSGSQSDKSSVSNVAVSFLSIQERVGSGSGTKRYSALHVAVVERYSMRLAAAIEHNTKQMYPLIVFNFVALY